MFLAGLELYAQGELEAGRGQVSRVAAHRLGVLPAAFYLGACYAAGGRDREAVGAWQTSLVTESDAPFIYTLLGDALLRLRDNDQALDILVEASGLWPDNEQVRLRLGTAQAVGGKSAEAVRTLDPYLAAHPEDHERLLIAMRAIYEARSAGKSIGTADEDRQRFNRYAAAYAAASGPAGAGRPMETFHRETKAVNSVLPSARRDGLTHQLRGLLQQRPAAEVPTCRPSGACRLSCFQPVLPSPSRSIRHAAIAQKSAGCLRARTTARLCMSLNRIGFGAAPGDIERVRRIGLQAYIEQQLRPERVADADMSARLTQFETLAKSSRELAEDYFIPAMMQKRRQKREQSA